MKNLSFIILGTIAMALIVLFIWQHMWMIDVVDNNDSLKSYKVIEEEKNIHKDILNDNSSDTKSTNRTAKDNTGYYNDNPITATDSNNDGMVQEEMKVDVEDQLSDFNNGDLRDRPVEVPDSAISTGNNKIWNRGRPIVSDKKERVTIKTVEGVISVNLGNDEPSHPTSTSPY